MEGKARTTLSNDSGRYGRRGIAIFDIDPGAWHNIHLNGRAVAKGESGVTLVLGDFTAFITHPLASTCAVAVVAVLFHSPFFPEPLWKGDRSADREGAIPDIIALNRFRLEHPPDATLCVVDDASEERDDREPSDDEREPAPRSDEAEGHGGAMFVVTSTVEGVEGTGADSEVPRSPRERGGDAGKINKVCWGVTASTRLTVVVRGG